MDATLVVISALVGWCWPPWPRPPWPPIPPWPPWPWPWPWPDPPPPITPAPNPWVFRLVGAVGGVVGGFAIGQVTEAQVVVTAIGALIGSVILNDVFGQLTVRTKRSS